MPEDHPAYAFFCDGFLQGLIRQAPTAERIREASGLYRLLGDTPRHIASLGQPVERPDYTLREQDYRELIVHSASIERHGETLSLVAQPGPPGKQPRRAHAAADHQCPPRWGKTRWALSLAREFAEKSPGPGSR